MVLELSNGTASICKIFALLFRETHNPKVVSSNLTRDLDCWRSRGNRADRKAAWERQHAGTSETPFHAVYLFSRRSGTFVAIAAFSLIAYFTEKSKVRFVE